MTEKPTLKAEFELDATGKPVFVADPRDPQRKHYRLKLFVEGAPANAVSVTYELDPTYYDPIRNVLRRSPQFQEGITSYGDFVVRATVRAQDGLKILRSPLSEALTRRYESTASSEAVRAAIKDLEEH